MVEVRICIYGAGAVGSHLAARLLQGGIDDVSVVARGAHLKAIESRGLTLRTAEGEWTVEPAVATSDPSKLPLQNLVVVTLKAPALAAEARKIRSVLHPNGAVVFFTNGIPWWWSHGLPTPQPLLRLDRGGELWHRLGAEYVIGGVVYSWDELVEPGIVLHRGSDRWILGEPAGFSSDRLNKVSEVLSKANIPVETTRDIRGAVLAKLVATVPASGVTALTRLQAREAALDPDVRRIELELAQETLAVAAALGWDLTHTVRLDEIFANLFERPGVTPSMLQDVLLGRPLEVEAIYGQIHSFASDVSVATPTMDVIVPLLRALDSSRSAARSYG